MRKHLTTIITFVCLSALVYILIRELRSPISYTRSQLVYPVVGTYKNKSAQGMAIWQDKAYLFNDGGHCRVMDLKSGIILREFNLASASEKTHVNAACFGKELYNNFPVIYISEYNKPSRCFVECVDDVGSKLIQTIQAKEDGNNVYVQSWIVDTEREHIYAIARQSPPKGEKNSSIVKITKYQLPKYKDGKEITLSEKNVLDFFCAEFSSGTQGGCIIGKYMYLPTGLAESSKGAFNAKRVLQIIDLEKKKLVKHIDLTYLTTNEPEDLDFYGDKCLLYCGQQGGIYEINLD